VLVHVQPDKSLLVVLALIAQLANMLPWAIHPAPTVWQARYLHRSAKAHAFLAPKARMRCLQGLLFATIAMLVTLLVQEQLQALVLVAQLARALEESLALLVWTA
tara:strand:- start:90 stop:404 length:315 start_codon:yes stop_codon:yes gene_type:complete